MKKSKLILSLLASALMLLALASCVDDIRGENVALNAEIGITDPVDSQYLQPEYLSFGYYKISGDEYLRVYLDLPKINQEVINIAPQYGGYDVRYLTTNVFDKNNTTTKKIIFPDTMMGIDGYVLSNFQALEEVVFSKSVSYISPLVFYHSNVKKVTIDKENEYYEVKNDALYQKKDNYFIHYLNNDDLKQYSVYQATDVLDYAFSNTSLESIVFGEGLERISSYAIDKNDKLTSITLPSTFKGFGYSYVYSGANAFYDSENGIQIYSDDPRFEVLFNRRVFESIKKYNPNLKKIYSHTDLLCDLSDLGVEYIKL